MGILTISGRIALSTGRTRALLGVSAYSAAAARAELARKGGTIPFIDGHEEKRNVSN